jgi:hypothetical protein
MDMAKSQRVVLLEFNELTPSLMSPFIESGRLPNFFWGRTPARRHAVEQQPVPLAAVAPTLLSIFGVTPPSYTAAPVGVGLGGRREMVAALV